MADIYKDLRQQKKYAEYVKSIGWKVDEFKGVFIYIKKILFWKFIKIQRPQKLVGRKLLGYLEENYRLSTVYVEPCNEKQYSELLRVGFKIYDQPFLPSRTVKIDLTKTENNLLNEMHQKTRYNIKKTQNSKLKTQNSKDFGKFADFWQKCARRRGMFLDQKKEIKAICSAFAEDAMIHVVVADTEWLAAVLSISTKDISYYMYAASTSEGKKLYAPTIVAWEAIKTAKAEGKKEFDFEGIYDERFPLDTWKGFTRFKKSFGGREVDYPGVVGKVVV